MSPSGHERGWSGRWPRGIRARLAAAFALVALMAVGAAGTAWWSVRGAERSLGMILDRQLPTVEHAHALVAAAAEFSALVERLSQVENQKERRDLLARLTRGMERMQYWCDRLRRQDFGTNELDSLGRNLERLRANLTRQTQLTDRFLAAQDTLALQVAQLADLHDQFVKLAQSRIDQGYREFLVQGEVLARQLRAQLALLGNNTGQSNLDDLDKQVRVGLGTIVNLAASEMRAELELVATTHLALGLMLQGAKEDCPDELAELARRYTDLLTTMRRLRLVMSSAPTPSRQALVAAWPVVRLGQGPQGIFALRQAELDARQEVSTIAAQSLALAQELENQARDVVGLAREQANHWSQRLLTGLDRAQRLQIIAAFLSVLVAVLIGWVYVGRQVISRLDQLRRAMEEQVQGFESPIPVEKDDEIGDMARALAMFVAQRHHHELRIRQSEERFRLLVENTSDVFWQLNRHQRVEYVSPAVSALLDYEPREVRGRLVREFFSERSWEAVRRRRRLWLRVQAKPQTGTDRTYVYEVELRRKDGESIWCEAAATPLRDEEGRLQGIQGVARDISHRKRQERLLKRLARVDSLTGVLNRRRFLELANREARRSRRLDHPLAIIMLDLDHFKQVNDTHGHAVGDQVLQSVTRMVGCEIRDIDVLGRLGGEEFAVLLPETDMTGAVALAQRLRQKVAQTSVRTEVGELRVTISLGVAVAAGGTAEINHLLQEADQKLYQAKGQGRDRVEPERV